MTFDNDRGFALGHNEAAPNPFVTWQFTETESGQRDYYWGHYHNEMKWAEKDFLKRIDDYKEMCIRDRWSMKTWGRKEPTRQSFWPRPGFGKPPAMPSGVSGSTRPVRWRNGRTSP